MASLSKGKNGRFTIQFMAPNGRRKSVRIGRIQKRDAESILRHVEELNNAQITGYAVHKSTADWLSEIGEDLHDRLVRAHLAEVRRRMSLEAFLEECLQRQKHLKPRTLDIFQRTKENLVSYFGADRSIDSITVGDAQDWRQYLLREGGRWNKPLAENTVRDRSKKARQMFRMAIDHEQITQNPFRSLPATVTCNREKLHFVSREETAKLLSVCPDIDWQLLIALCRFGGLRNPSETFLLRWDHINWTDGRIKVLSPKTEHHENGAFRMIPIFPELREHLKKAMELDIDTTGTILTKWHDQKTNLRTQLRRMIRKAGLTPWPRAFHNMRSSRQTELEESFPSHVVCRWIGNSEQIARKHYLQLTDEHFERAIESQKALQNPVQYLQESPRTGSQTENS